MNKVVKTIAALALEAVILGGFLFAVGAHVTDECDTCGQLFYSKGNNRTSCEECHTYNTFVRPYLNGLETVEDYKAGN